VNAVLTVASLVTLLARRTLARTPGNTLRVSYRTDMLGKGKLRASARAAFPNGIWHEVTRDVNVNYDYGKKYEARTGEAAPGTGNWQQAVIIDGRVSPLTTHRDDVIGNRDDTTIVARSGRFYLRYEPLTEAQRAAGFGKGNTSRYVDNDGKIIPDATVAPHFGSRAAQPVEHRTLTLSNVTYAKIDGTEYTVDAGRAIGVELPAAPAPARRPAAKVTELDTEDEWQAETM
jgi:hypothetical protein